MSKPVKYIATIEAEWIDPKVQLPPGEETGWFSPNIWLALRDGSVVQGCCLHKSKCATYPEPGPHSWFAENTQIDPAMVVAWMPFIVPTYNAKPRRIRSAQ